MPKIVDEQAREATRRHIVSQAAREFARLGFDQANMNTLAEQAGIGKGTIYLYFENKRELFLTMLRYIAQDHISAIRPALAVDGTIQQRLEGLFGAFVRLAQDERDNFNVYMSALYGVNRSFRAEATRLLHDYIASIALLLEQSQARGEIRCQNVEAIALMILSLTESYVLSAHILGQSEQSIRLQACLVSELILHGIALSS